MKRVLLIDAHPLTRKGLAMLLETEVGLSVCGEAGSSEEAITLFKKEEPDFVILDIALPGMSGLTLIEQLHRRRPHLPILVVTDELQYAVSALRAGARGYITKRGADAEMVQAVQRVFEGHLYVTNEICDKLLEDMVSGGANTPPEVLSRRELEVFELIGQGVTSQEIAERLGLSPKTIDSYRRRIKQKLHLRASIELIQQAVRWMEGRVGSGHGN